MSQEYIGAIAILVISVLKIFHFEIENEVVAGLVTGVIALYIAIRRKAKGDINVLGVKK